MCERELETKQNCNILTSILMAISVSFPFSWAAQPEARGFCSLLGAGFLYRILSPTGLVSKTQSGVPRAPSAGCCFSQTASSLQTDWISCALSYIIVQRQLLWNGMFWSSSSGNKSCSSQVTLFRCISLWLYRGMLTLSHIVSQARPRQWNMHFRRLWNVMFRRIGGLYKTQRDRKKRVQL